MATHESHFLKLRQEKALLEMSEASVSIYRPKVLYMAFIARHNKRSGFDTDYDRKWY